MIGVRLSWMAIRSWLRAHGQWTGGLETQHGRGQKEVRAIGQGLEFKRTIRLQDQGLHAEGLIDERLQVQQLARARPRRG